MLSTRMSGEGRIALLVIDPQRKFWSDRPDFEEARDAAVARMNRLIHIFRRSHSITTYFDPDVTPFSKMNRFTFHQGFFYTISQ